MTQAAFADTLGASRSHLCDIEKGRETVGRARAARFATILGRSPESFVALAFARLVCESFIAWPPTATIDSMQIRAMSSTKACWTAFSS